jgi:hypothetical protein
VPVPEGIGGSKEHRREITRTGRLASEISEFWLKASRHRQPPRWVMMRAAGNKKGAGLSSGARVKRGKPP